MSNITTHRTRKNMRRCVTTLLFWTLVSCSLVQPYTALAADEECDTTMTGHIFNSPAEDLCVSAIGTTSNYTLDGFDGDWVNGNFYDHMEYFGGGTQTARVRVSRKAVGINKSDLYLFFEAHGDAVATGLDEIRIGLNPGTNSANSTLIKIHPAPVMPTLPKETFTFNPGPGTWTSAGSGDAWLPPANVHYRNDAVGASWYVEMKISLNNIPVNPITTAGFRLYMELIADDNVTPIDYEWPQQYGYAGLHDFICSNPNRWHPMSFGTGCFPDLNIANGLYSCDAVYVLRNGLKSTEIGVNEINEIHADVTNPDASKNASNAVVYLTLLKLGISGSPIAANYDNADASITNFFNDKYGNWLLATDKLDSGTPKPPTFFNVTHMTTNTAARFNWRPSDETRFGPPAGFVGTHKCTGAFVNFKDDPNFDNNFAYCNTSIVNCPAGEICAMSMILGQAFPFGRPQGVIASRLLISAVNAPNAGWLKRAELDIAGEGVKRINNTVFEAPVPMVERGEAPLRMKFNVPKAAYGSVYSSDESNVADAAHFQPKRGVDPNKVRSDRLKKMYGNRPIVVIEGFSPNCYESARGKRERVQLYRPTSYVAFVIDTKPKKKPVPARRPPRG